MNQLWYLIMIEFVNSKVIFNRSYKKITKIGIFCAINIAVLLYMMGNAVNERPKNLYEKMGLTRKNYEQEDLNQAISAMTQDAVRSGMTTKEISNIKANGLAFVDPVKNKHYEVTGTVFFPEEGKDSDYDIESQLRSLGFSKVASFYLFSFVMF